MSYSDTKQPRPANPRRRYRGGDEHTMPPGPGGVVNAAIDTDDAINKEYREPPHSPGLDAIRRRSGRSRTRRQGRRAAVGVLRRCPDGFFEVALAVRWHRGREGRGGATRFARCGRPGWCWPGGRGCRTTARRDYSVALLFQLAVWTTLQFRRLRVAVTIPSSFLELTLHSTLPPVATATIVHAFEEYCGGGGGGSADFVLLAAPYVFAFHMAMGVRLVGLAPLRFGAGGDGRGGPSELGPGNVGKGSNNGGGADRRWGQWRWCKQRWGQWLACSCNDELAAGGTTVPWHRRPSHAHWRDVELAAGRFTVPRHCWNSLACWCDVKLAAGRTTMPRHCRPFPCLLV